LTAEYLFVWQLVMGIRVRSAIYGLGLENFPKKCQIFNFFPSGKKNLFGSGQKVLGSKVD